MHKHEISNEETLEVLETVYDIYSACNIAKNYSDTIEVSASEFLGTHSGSIREVLLCTSKKFLGGYLTFPYVRRWKNNGETLLIKDVFCPNDFCVNEWKEYPEISEYTEKRLIETPVLEIADVPESKNIIVNEQTKETLLFLKSKLGLQTIDEAILVVLEKTRAMRFVITLTRLFYDNITVEELKEIFKTFGSFFFIFAYQRDDSYIRIVHEFFPYNYNMEFTKFVR
ncbi:hypothetical protein [Saccharolobus shibatae]|uniref:Uncharacterized protein n=1 Tax=Saccharolobus shibatae TaxID=2286 RepID=A0A8F5H0W8_9CREN|nr:hypothetical protein [Saccharolobus shibatae]QXJ36586.1 hypothetical protein J5U22_03163 [Saccharolobus shibatae]